MNGENPEASGSTPVLEGTAFCSPRASCLPEKRLWDQTQSQQRPLGPALVLLQVLSKGKINTNSNSFLGFSSTEKRERSKRAMVQTEPGQAVCKNHTLRNQAASMSKGPWPPSPWPLQLCLLDLGEISVTSMESSSSHPSFLQKPILQNTVCSI